MCDPVTATIASTVAQGVIGAVTGGMQSRANSSGAAKVAQGNLQAQRTFQKDLDTQRDAARGYYQKSLDRAGKAAYDEDYANEVARIETQNQPSFAQDVFLPGQENAGGAIETAVRTSQNKAIANNAANAKLAAALQGYGATGFNRGIDLNRNADNIAMYGDFAKGAYDNLAAEKQYADTLGIEDQQKADKMGALGTLLGAGVNAAGQYFIGKAPTFKTVKTNVDDSLAGIPGVQRGLPF